MEDTGVRRSIAAPERKQDGGGEVGVGFTGREGQDVDMRLSRGRFGTAVV